MPWDPTHYLRYGGERGRPYGELLTRVQSETPHRVVDLGCGPGNLTALLAERWPGADVLGIDSSPEMIERARADVRTCRFEVGDAASYAPTGAERPDVLISNATFQWLPGHLNRLPQWYASLAPGGTFAFSVPGNFDEPSHTLRRDVADREPYRAYTREIAAPDSRDASVYLSALAAAGASVDAWETTYLHVLDASEDPDPVFTWVSATGARPTLEALGAVSADLRDAFEGEFKAALREAYPVLDVGGRPSVVLPFRRIFVVAT